MTQQARALLFKLVDLSSNPQNPRKKQMWVFVSVTLSLWGTIENF